jgi:hypothetical protein
MTKFDIHLSFHQFDMQKIVALRIFNRHLPKEKSAQGFNRDAPPSPHFAFTNPKVKPGKMKF